MERRDSEGMKKRGGDGGKKRKNAFKRISPPIGKDRTPSSNFKGDEINGEKTKEMSMTNSRTSLEELGSTAYQSFPSIEPQQPPNR